jgi:uncharacterized protein YbcI
MSRSCHRAPLNGTPGGTVVSVQEPQTSQGPPVRSQISRRIVQLLKEFYGRGPVDAKTYYQDDHVLVILTGGFTQVEHTLIDAGEGQAVEDQRGRFQELMRDRFVGAIEEITGREVVSFMSANDHGADAMVDIFLLRPLDATAAG